MVRQSLTVSSSRLPPTRAEDTFRRRTDRCEAMKRPRSLHSQLTEKVIRHQAERAAVSANKWRRPRSRGQKGGCVGASNQEVTGGCEGLSCRWMQTGQLPTLTFKWHRRLTSAVIVGAFLFMYIWNESCVGVCVCARVFRDRIWRSDGIIHTRTLSVCLSVISSSCGSGEWIWRSAEGTVTPRQGDTSGQVCACDCPPVCQRFVPGQQVATQRTSVTFSLSLPPPLQSHPPATPPRVPIHPRFHTTSPTHTTRARTHAQDTAAGGLFMNLGAAVLTERRWIM